MKSNEFERLYAIQEDNVFVDREGLKSIRHEWETGAITEDEAIARLRSLERHSHLRSSTTIADDWGALVHAINTSERVARRIATGQFQYAIVSVPLVVLFVLLALLLRWHTLGAVAVSAVMTSCLATTIAHSFFAMRVQQQAGLAAERLTEKRLGILFLRIAVSRKDSEESRRLLDAGMQMFLCDHVASTLPLQPNDFTAIRKS